MPTQARRRPAANRYELLHLQRLSAPHITFVPHGFVIAASVFGPRSGHELTRDRLLEAGF
jgi:hypothetical protein